MPDYWLDSNTLIESHRRYYAFDIVPGFWRFIADRAANGVIASSIRVFDEVTGGSNDDLAKWARAQKDVLFVAPDQGVQSSFTDIANHVLNAYPVHAGPFLAGADPWLIAHARTHGGVVVTQEKSVTGGSKPKIPNVCAQFGVESCDLFAMLRRLGARLG